MWRRALIGLGLLACLACGSPDPTSPSISGPANVSSTVTATSAVTTVSPTTSATKPAPEPQPLEVMVFHKTAGFAHDSISAGIQAIRELAGSHGWEVAASDDAATFAGSGLETYAVIVFLNTTGDVLDEAQQEAMERFVQSGGGFVGIHSAADTEYEWSWYGDLVGAYFSHHPAPQEATVEIRVPDHPVVEGLPASIERFDEWYNFRSVPDAQILAALDEDSYEGGTMGDPHPIIWARQFDGGRSVYTGFGHTSESFSEPDVLDHLANAIRWAAGQAD